MVPPESRFQRLYRRTRVLTKLGAALLDARIRRARKPIFVGLYITNRCNLRCRYCFVNVDERFEDPAHWGFTTEEVLSLIDELHAMGTRWIFLLGGEPLMHQGIGQIVRHIVSKDMLLHILTNGTLIEKHIDDIALADAVCVSIDGLEKSTDLMRGEGTFKRALHGIEVAVERGMKARIHAVLSKSSLHELEDLARLAKDMEVPITVSPPNYLGASDDPELQLSEEDYRDFYRRYRLLKERGFPIANSFHSIDKALEWPTAYHRFIRKGEDTGDYKPVPCVMGELHGCIDAEGTMFNCIQKGCLDGLNVKEVGVQAAWDELPNRRRECVSCASVNTIETAAYTKIHPAILTDALRFFFGRRK